MSSRLVTLVLVTGDGKVLGAMPPFEVDTPWWQEVGEFGDERRPVLRLLSVDGREVTYLAETAVPVAGLRPVDVDLGPDPRRAPYAEPGGPAASLAWARSVLGPVTAKQMRTWNLSSIWRLDDGGRTVAWLKQVPSFFGHEPAALRLVDSLAPGLVPPLLAAGADGRMLLAHVEGDDRYGGDAELCERIAEAFHPVQVAAAGRAADLAAIPDGRIDVERVRRVAAPHFDTVDGLAELIDDLPGRLKAVDECGLPDTLVHGDLHPGNVRTDDAGRLTTMDWGDCVIGHPAIDILRLTERLDAPEPVIERWAYRWEKAQPGSRPLRSAQLMRPIAALRFAVVYAGFLDAIEPTEWPYHRDDVPACLSDAVAASIVKG
ncbi:aminoglycoside phosphotransferase family protein [Actinoplanes sp. KI2]|uniref:phosphotransferase family protein n=1 Tax=Actinoplanes sp. KI2 TaxID=2983315 RepID=UPI0021D5AD68|nr:aminoglycoside phosphotransferase family protein [Actinoplanes sp. KI2]MCU7724726.1 aminoglycoside phosphotransferase family protein [Actinoplanes sp. KI2]